MNIIDKLIQMDKESPRRILIIGDPMTDVYIHGRLEECQEGCPKFIEESRVMVPGGAKNAYCSLRHWKSHVQCPVTPIIGCIKTRIMVDNKCVFRHDMDNWTDGLDLGMIRRANVEFMYLYKPHAVLISDYDKGLLTPEMINSISEFCAENNIPCVADAKRELDVYKGCIIKGNGEWGVKYFGNEAVRLPEGSYVETHGMGYPGVWEYNRWIVTKIPNLPLVNCINHVGAGDCFAAHMTLALAYGFSLKDAAAIGHSAGRVYVQHLHNEPPTIEAIREDTVLSRET